MAELLTDLKVKRAKPGEKRYTLFDSGGLYLEVAPTGGKWWRLRYAYGGKKKVLSLGTYPDVSLKNARDKRDDARTLLANGKDPAVELKANKLRSAFPTFSAAALEWFAVKSSSWSEGHKKTVRLRLEKYLIGPLDFKPFTDLEVSDFIPILRAIEKLNKYETAHRIAQLCNQICRFARLSGIIKTNPVENIADILVRPKSTPMAAITDPAEIAQLLRLIRDYPGRPVTSLALRIMPYVFVRSVELRGARWAEIDLEKSLWVIPAERMKKRREHVVPLATQVVNLFRQLREISGRGELCFPSPMSATRPISDVGLLNGLRRIGYERGEMCIHGFRSMASTLLNEQGYRPDIIEMQLAHVQENAVRAAYNRAEYLDERKKMMQEWADYLDKLRDNR